MQRLVNTTASSSLASEPNHVLALARELTVSETAVANLCAHEIFEAQAARTPDAVAVVCGEINLSYRELNERANQLAYELVGLGVGSDSLIGICIDRSPEMVVALLATLKAGGAYVPLDPTYPRDRLAFMLSDARVRVLLTQSDLVNKLPFHDCPRLALDTDWSRIEKHSTDNLSSRIAPDNLAYVIYTSGSTGQPKGTMITHRGLTNYLNWATEAYAVADGCGAPVHSSISFDLDEFVRAVDGWPQRFSFAGWNRSSGSRIDGAQQLQSGQNHAGALARIG